MQVGRTWQDLECMLQGIEGVPKISQDYNPATWMLEVTNVAVENRTGQDFAALYANSDMYRFATTLPSACCTWQLNVDAHISCAGRQLGSPKCSC